jgi:hypothetical protein
MTTLLDLMTAPPIRRAIDPDGQVVATPDETLRFDGGKRWLGAEIELHRDAESGFWMWSVSYQLPDRGSCYRVGPKWGKFAASRMDALAHARAELRDRLKGCEASAGALAGRMIAWAERLS